MIGDLTGAWGTLKRDPLWILLPASGALLVQVALLLALQHGYRALPLEAFVGWALAALAIRTLFQSPFHAPLLSAAARAMGRPGRWLGRIPALVLVEGVIAFVQLALAAILAAPGLVLCGFLLGRGLLFGAVLTGGLGLLGAALGVLLGRAALGYAPVEVVVGSQGPFRALGQAFRRSRRELPQLLVLVAAGQGVLALGGALCGAGALPGYPVRDLALLHRWAKPRTSGKE